MKTARNSLHCVFGSTHSGVYQVNESVKLVVTDTMVAARALFTTRFVKGRKEGGPASLRSRKRETPRRFTPESRRETKVYSGLASAGVIRGIALCHVGFEDAGSGRSPCKKEELTISSRMTRGLCISMDTEKWRGAAAHMIPRTTPSSRLAVDPAKRTQDAVATSRERRAPCASGTPGPAAASVGPPSMPALPGRSGVDSSATAFCCEGLAGESGAFAMVFKCVSQ